MTTDRPSTATLTAGARSYRYVPIADLPGVDDLPLVLKLLLENVRRCQPEGAERTIAALAAFDPSGDAAIEVHFEPRRVLSHDTTGVPLMVDLATLRDAMVRAGGDVASVQPSVPVDLVIDHSLTVDVAAHPRAMERNIEIEYRRNSERYRFLQWAGRSVDGVTVVPPGAGIVHQVNVEHLAEVVSVVDGDLAIPDTLVGTDSHTTMVNGLGVLAWGVGGIEALAAMLGEGIALRVPEVVTVELTGELPEGSTATDLVLRITELLRERGVVGAFVEFTGPGVSTIGVPDRATIANMSPEFGSTCAMFPIDERTMEYLTLTGRSEQQVALVEAYARAQGLWHDPHRQVRATEQLRLDLGTVTAAIAGPSRPERRIALESARGTWRADVAELYGLDAADPSGPVQVSLEDGQQASLDHGHVAVAAITSCTNTSNPALMLAAALLARNAVERGLVAKPWVKTSMAPGSQVVIDYIERAGLLPAMEKLGFGLVGFGCTTCIGNTGPLAPPIADAARDHGLRLASVLSGNRNFEGRISPDVATNYLASPPLVVAYALAGTMDLDLTSDPLGVDPDGRPVTLAELWPSSQEIQDAIGAALDGAMFTDRYAHLLDGDERWRALDAPSAPTYDWDGDSTYLREAPYLWGFVPDVPPVPASITDARVLAFLGDAVTTDHLSPAGAILPDSEAAAYLLERGVGPQDFNTYPTRRGNHEVLIRAALANPRLRNRLVPDGPGGTTRDLAVDGPVVTPRQAAEAYRAAGTPLVIVAGRNYGNGSSRDWAAKGPALLGVEAVLAVDLERIHRSNLVGMGVLPLQFLDGDDADTVGLVGDETLTITGLERLADGPTDEPAAVTATPPSDSGRAPFTFPVRIRLDTEREVAYHRHGGIMPFVLRRLLADDEDPS